MGGKSSIMSTEVFTEEKASVSRGFKTTLTKAARQRLNVSVGDKVKFMIMSNGEVVVKKADGE